MVPHIYKKIYISRRYKSVSGNIRLKKDPLFTYYILLYLTIQVDHFYLPTATEHATVE